MTTIVIPYPLSLTLAKHEPLADYWHIGVCLGGVADGSPYTADSVDSL